MDLEVEGGLATLLERISKSQDNREAYAIVKKILLKAVGTRSKDGSNKFIRNQKIRDEFEGSDAYSELAISIMSEDDGGAAFMNGLLPQNVVNLANDEEKTEDKEPPTASVPAPQYAVAALRPKVLTTAEIDEMSPNELKSGLATGKYTLGHP